MRFRGYEVFDFDEDFDWMIILDACRYDYFKKLWDISDVEPRASLGSCTLEVLANMPIMRDTIVVSSHPFVYEYKDKFGYYLDAGFDHKLSTCPPSYIMLKVLSNMSLLKRYMRRILWFLQPHHPYIGLTKLDIRIYENDNKTLTPQEKTIHALREAKKRGILLKAYEDNLKLVLSYVRKLLNVLKGKIIITSDHAEGLGEPLHPDDEPIYSHPCNRNELELRLIPYCVIYR